MGMETFVFGYIAEPWMAHDDSLSRFFRNWNRRVLSELPQQDEWPPLLRGLFAWTEFGSARGGYRGSVIHFGGRFRSIENAWDEWLVKYERLLQRLYWESSVVHLDTELYGSHRFEWSSSMDGLLASPPQFSTTWNFKGPFRRLDELTNRTTTEN